jgi:glycosyltransferase involved in cell wall biosynthesis
MENNMKKIFMFVNVDWFFFSHRMVIANAAKANQIDMSVYTDFTSKNNSHNIEKFNLFQSPLSRTSKFFGYELIEFFKAFMLIKKNKPDLIHAVTIKPILLLGVIARITKTPFVGAISGLGPAFIQNSWKSRLRLKIILILYAFIFKSPCSSLICQNQNDVNILLDHGVCSQKQIFIIIGSGVDLHKYSPLKADIKKKPFILMACRMLTDKGVMEFCSAAKTIINKHKCKVQFKLAGPIDIHSPTSISEHNLKVICNKNNVEYLGNRIDMNILLATAKIFVYPSYYPEGIPKVLLEAAASGTPILTTDHPGCKDAIIYGKTGFTVEPKNVEELSNMILKMLKSNDLNNMGIEARKFAELQFNENHVITKHFEIYSMFI